jgi:hypothetical protein
MSKIAALAAVAILVFAAQASARTGDYRSPDAKAGAAQQDYRSPDTQRPLALRRSPLPAELRSPDARPSGGFTSPVVAPTTSEASSSFDWGYLAVGSAVALAGIAVMFFTQRRRHHGLAAGG